VRQKADFRILSFRLDYRAVANLQLKRYRYVGHSVERRRADLLRVVAREPNAIEGELA
jgi:hypothetical protein